MLTHYDHYYSFPLSNYYFDVSITKYFCGGVKISETEVVKLYRRKLILVRTWFIEFFQQTRCQQEAEMTPRKVLCNKIFSINSESQKKLKRRQMSTSKKLRQKHFPFSASAQWKSINFSLVIGYFSLLCLFDSKISLVCNNFKLLTQATILKVKRRQKEIQEKIEMFPFVLNSQGCNFKFHERRLWAVSEK